MEYEIVLLGYSPDIGVSNIVKARKHGDWVKLVRTGFYDIGPFNVLYIVCDDGKYGGYAYHRLDGPAVVRPHEIEFFVHDEPYIHTKDYCRAAGMSAEETFMWVLRYGEKLPTTGSEYYGEGWESIPFDQL